MQSPVPPGPSAYFSSSPPHLAEPHPPRLESGSGNPGSTLLPAWRKGLTVQPSVLCYNSLVF